MIQALAASPADYCLHTKDQEQPSRKVVLSYAVVFQSLISMLLIQDAEEFLLKMATCKKVQTVAVF